MAVIHDLLMLKGADPNKGSAEYKGTPLLAASYHGHVEIVELLLRCESDVNAADSSTDATRGVVQGQFEHPVS